MENVRRKSRARRGPSRSARSEALRVLERNRRYTERKNAAPWQYAVLVSTLEAAGLKESDLRWLIAQGYVEHAVEVTKAGEKERRFRRRARPRFDLRSCFVLTEAGASFALRTCNLEIAASSTTGLPRWDAVRRELRVGEVVVKRFRGAAPNQTTILAAFEEQCWPERIDDPLPADPYCDSSERLHDAIKNLNRDHLVRLVRFHGDGTGKGIRWQTQGT